MFELEPLANISNRAELEFLNVHNKVGLNSLYTSYKIITKLEFIFLANQTSLTYRTRAQAYWQTSCLSCSHNWYTSKNKYRISWS